MAKRDVELEHLTQSWDWQEVFGQGGGGNTDRSVEVAPPGAAVSSDPVDIADVVEVVAAVNGENDESSWLGVFRIKDGRYVVAEGSCDYTGWDCQASNSITVLGSMDDVLKYGLSEPERRRLEL